MNLVALLLAGWLARKTARLIEIAFARSTAYAVTTAMVVVPTAIGAGGGYVPLGYAFASVALTLPLTMWLIHVGWSDARG